MAWKEVPSSFGEAWKPEKKGAELIGHYLGTADIPYEGRTFTSYRFRNGEGRVINCAGGMLSSKIDQVPIGALCKITFRGMVKTKSGNAKDFDVQVDSTVGLLDGIALARANAAELQSGNAAGDNDELSETAFA